MFSEQLHVFGGELAPGAHLEEVELDVEMMRFFDETGFNWIPGSG